MGCKCLKIVFKNFLINDAVLYSTILDIAVSIFGILFMLRFVEIFSFRFDYCIMYAMCLINLLLSIHYLFVLYYKNSIGSIIYIFWNFVSIFIITSILFFNAYLMFHFSDLFDLLKIVLFWFILKEKLNYTFLIISYHQNIIEIMNDLPPSYNEIVFK